MEIKSRIIQWFLEGILKTIRTGKINWRTKIVAGQVAKEINQMDNKRWYTSKTLWVNALIGIGGVLTALTSDKSIDPKVVGYAATGVGILNMILRMITNKGIQTEETK